MTNYAIKKELKHATDGLAAKKDFTALKVGADKLDINNLINALTSLNNFKTKVNDLDVGSLKTVPVDKIKQSSG